MAMSQRDRVLNAYDAQRAAVLKMVNDQRTATLSSAPARGGQGGAPGTPLPPGMGTGALGAGNRPQVVGHRRDLVAADIVAAVKALVAEEVRNQLHALLRAVVERHDETPNTTVASERQKT